ADIHFEEYLKALTESLQSSLGGRSHKVEIVTDMDEIVLNADAAIPCGLIINEIIMNSFKHAFPEDGEGEVRITVRKNDPADITMKVSDNGIGMPEGVNFDRPDSLGLELIKTLAEKQLGGTIELRNANGTEYTITFSELPYRTGE
ncbi:MAG: sensor histidine kinase, partial [Candidatus Thorarchaeota archaeon]